MIYIKILRNFRTLGATGVFTEFIISRHEKARKQNRFSPLCLHSDFIFGIIKPMFDLGL
jgi:hypothetical protein